MNDATETSRSVVRLFGILQGLVFVVVAVTVYLRWKKAKDQEEALKIKLDQMNFKAGQTRQAAGAFQEAGKENTPDSEVNPAEPLQISSALPNWPPGTSPEQILGISSNATKQQIEKAYKTLLKKYHPDRFESWGKGYKTRAHYIVLQVQKARDAMLGKLK